MYSYQSRVRYSEVDYNGNITLTAILDHFQDCSTFHSEDLNVGVEFLEEHHVAWVLISWQIKIEEYPRLGQGIQVSTWPYDFKGFYGSRNFQLSDEQGKVLAYANSLWVLMDLDSGRPTRLLPEMEEAYQLEPPLDMGPMSRKRKLPVEMEAQETFSVHRYHLDTNQHVNNGKYILMALEYWTDDATPRMMEAEYRKSAVYGDTIYPFVIRQEQGILVALCDEHQVPYAIVELK